MGALGICIIKRPVGIRHDQVHCSGAELLAVALGEDESEFFRIPVRFHGIMHGTLPPELLVLDINNSRIGAIGYRVDQDRFGLRLLYGLEDVEIHLCIIVAYIGGVFCDISDASDMSRCIDDAVRLES